MKTPRTTHSDAARLLLDHAERLKAIPAGYLVSDASTDNLLKSIAVILVEQDQRIEQMTVALRDCRALLPPGAQRDAVNRALAK